MVPETGRTVDGPVLAGALQSFPELEQAPRVEDPQGETAHAHRPPDAR